MVTSVDNIILVFTARGVNRVSQQVNALGKGSAAASKSVGILAGSLSGLGAILAVRQVVAYADTFTELENRLRLVTNSTEEVTNATQNLFDIASRTRGNIEETGRIYFRFARANDRLGLSQQQLLDVTETIGQAVAFSGTSAESASSALFQFSQGIAAGTLRGQELNSVLEQIPGLAEVVARGLGVGVDALRAMGEAGELTGKQIAQAILSQREFAAEQFGRIVFTVSQEFERLRTEVIRYIGGVNKATGFTHSLAKGIAFLSENINLLVDGLTVVGALILRAFAPKVIAAVRGFGLALAANPIGAVILAVSTLVTVLVGFREEIVVFESSGATLGTVLEVTFTKIKEGAIKAFGAATEAASKLFEELTGSTPTQAFNNLLGVTDDGLNGVLDALRQFANPALGLITFPVRVGIELWRQLPSALGDLLFTALETLRQILVGTFDWEGFWTGVTDFVVDVFSNAFDFVVKKGEAAFNALRNLDFTLPEITIPDINFDFLDTPIENEFAGSLEKFGAGLQKVINETFSRDFVSEAVAIGQRIKTELIDPLIRDFAAAQAAKDALAAAEGARPAPSTEVPDLGPQPPEKKIIDEVNKLTERFQAQTDKLRESLDFLRLYRDEVEKFPDSFEVSVDQVDRAITQLENRIAGTVDLQVALWETAAEASRAALVDTFLDPLNASFKDLALNFVKAMQQIVAEALAAQAVLAALNFLQGFIGFQIPGATKTAVPGSQHGQTAIGGAARLVGEDGPEIIIPQSRSSVIPNNKLGGGGGAGQAEIRQLTALVAKMASQQKAISIINSSDPRNSLVALETAKGREVQTNNMEADKEINQAILGF